MSMRSRWAETQAAPGARSAADGNPVRKRRAPPRGDAERPSPSSDERWRQRAGCCGAPPRRPGPPGRLRRRALPPVHWHSHRGHILILLGALSCFATVLLCHLIAWAEVPRTIHYQSRLTESDGTPLTGEHTITTRLYDSPLGGTKLWEEQHSVTFARSDSGVFSMQLGGQTPFSPQMSFNNPLWLAVEVDGTGEFSPRQSLSAVTYAINADMVDGMDSKELIAAASAAGGDVMAVQAGAGLSGGGAQGDVTLDVGAGAGILVGPDSISVDVGTSAGKIVQLDGEASLPAVSGAKLVSLNASQLTAGTVDNQRLSSNVSLLGSSIESSEIADGALTAADTSNGFLSAGNGITVTKNDQTWTIASTAAGGTASSVVAGAGLTGTASGGQTTLDIGAGTAMRIGPDSVSVDVGTGPGQVVQLDTTGVLPAVNGAALIGLNASNLASGTVPDARLSASVSLLGASVESQEITDSTLTAADTGEKFLIAGTGVAVTKAQGSWEISAVGSGGDITGVTAGAGLIGGGSSGGVTLDIGAGKGIVVGQDVISVDVGTSAGKIVQLDGSAALPAVSGAKLTGLNASQLTTGTIPDARLSSHVSLLGPTIQSSELGQDSVDAAVLSATAIQPGDIEPGDLPAHASLHRPGGSDPLPTASAVAIGSANAAGTSTSLARADHIHEGVHSISVSGNALIFGDAVLTAGPNINLSQSGGTITVGVLGAGAPGGRTSGFASDAVTIATASDTTLLSVTVNKTRSDSVLFILVTVQLNHSASPTSKTVDLKLFRAETQLDASYRARLGTSAGTVQNIPVMLQAWDTVSAGSQTITLRARSSGAGAQATVRRLTVIELL